MTEKKLEELRQVIKEWFDKRSDFTYLTKDVYGTNFYIYFVYKADFIRDGLYLPLSFTSTIFDIRKLDATNELKKFLEKFDEDCKNQIERRLDDFPIGVTNFL